MCEQFRATALDPGGFTEKVRLTGPLTSELLVLSDTMDAAATSVTVSAGAKQLVRNTDYSASFAGGKLTIKLLSATSAAILRVSGRPIRACP